MDCKSLVCVLFFQLLGVAFLGIGLWAWSEKVSVLLFVYASLYVICMDHLSAKKRNMNPRTETCVRLTAKSTVIGSNEDENKM